MIHSITQNRIIKKTFFATLTAAFWLSVWQIASVLANNELIVVGPVKTICRLFELTGSSKFWLIILMTFLRLLYGFVIGTVSGVVLAVVAYKIKFINTLISPFMNVVRAIPVASFIMFLLVWSKNATIPVITAFIMVLPIVWGNIFEGLKQVNKNLLDMADVFEFGGYKKLIHIYVPSVMPYFISSVITSVGLAWKAAIAAEVLCQPENSIGKMLQGAKIYLETTDLFAWTLAVIIISIAIENLLKFALRRYNSDYRRGA